MRDLEEGRWLLIRGSEAGSGRKEDLVSGLCFKGVGALFSWDAGFTSGIASEGAADASAEGSSDAGPAVEEVNVSLAGSYIMNMSC